MRKKNLDNRLTLNKKAIMNEYLPTSTVLLIVLVNIFLIILFGSMIPSMINKSLFNNYYFILFGLVLFIPLLILFMYIIKFIKVYTGGFIIVRDTLKDTKKERASTDIFGNLFHSSHYFLYFKKLFIDYNTGIEVKDSKYYNAKVGGKYYLVFLKNSKKPYIFEEEYYKLSDKLEDKVVDIIELDNYTKLEKDEEYPTGLLIDKKRLLNDINTHNSKMSVLLLIIINMLLVFISITSLFITKNIIIMSIPLVIFFIVLGIICYKVSSLSTYRSFINTNRFYIKKDSVKNIIKNADTNTHKIYVNIETNSGINICDSIDLFPNTKKRDILYLVYLDGEDKPLLVYNSKYYKLSRDLNKRVEK